MMPSKRPSVLRRATKRRAAVITIVVLAGFVAGNVALAAFTATSSSTTSTVSAAGTFARCYSDEVQLDNPVSHWKLNETSGTTALDEEAGARNGTYTNFGATLGGSGALADPDDKAPTFDGLDDYVDMANTAPVQLSTGTVEAWINASAPGTGYRTIIAKRSAYGLFLKSGVLVTYDWGAATERATYANLADGKWHHVAMSFQSGVAADIYIDGILVANTLLTVAGQGSALTVGANGGIQQMSGRIDEPAVYNTRLSATRILAHYNAGRCYRDEPPTDSPVGYWRLGETAGTATAFDSKNTNHGTYNNGVTLAQPGGIDGDPGKAASFDGVDDYVEIGNAAALQIGTGTAEAWIKTSNAGTLDRAILIKPRAYSLFLSNNVLGTYDWGASSFRSTGVNVADGRWHHVAVSFASGVTNGTKVYLDGILKLTTTMTVTSQAAWPQLGASVGYPQYFAGQIDDAAVYSTNLSEARIRAHYIAGRSYLDVIRDRGPVAYWRLGEGSGTDTASVTGSHHGTYVGGPLLGQSGAVAGDGNTAVSLDGTNDQVSIPESAALDPGLGSFSWETWFQTSATVRVGLYHKSDNSNANGAILEMGSAIPGRVRIWVHAPGIITDSPIAYNDGAWHHAVGVLDRGTNQLRLYVDGTLSASTDASSIASVDLNSVSVSVIGSISGQYFPGKLDEFAVYGRALAADEVQLHYNAGKDSPR